MTDLIERAEECMKVFPGVPIMRELVAELKAARAEVERLQSGGAWMEHVERQRAMKRERDGDCICNTGPDSDGPDEFCPWHGRSYNELLDIVTSQQAELNRMTNA